MSLIKLKQNLSKFSSGVDNTQLKTLLESIKDILTGSLEEDIEILGHDDLIFCKEQNMKLIDYAIKRALRSTAIDNRENQRNYLILSFFLIDLYSKQLNFVKLADFIIGNISLKNVVNKTEKYYFSFSYLNLLSFLLNYKNVNLELVEKITKMIELSMKKLEFSKLYLSSILHHYCSKGLEKIVENVLNQNLDVKNFIDLSLILGCRKFCLKFKK